MEACVLSRQYPGSLQQLLQTQAAAPHQRMTCRRNHHSAIKQQRFTVQVGVFIGIRQPPDKKIDPFVPQVFQQGLTRSLHEHHLGVG